MAHAYAQPFYASKAWRDTRRAYMASVGWVCERCGQPASIVHHKHYISEGNISNPAVALDWANLEALCQTCHNREHSGTDATAPGLRFNSRGELVRDGESVVVNASG